MVAVAAVLFTAVLRKVVWWRRRKVLGWRNRARTLGHEATQYTACDGDKLMILLGHVEYKI